MKILEIRRHSIRSAMSDHLNQTGITLARLVGQNIGPFDRVVTSTLPRAFETAIAMGFAVDEQTELAAAFQVSSIPTLAVVKDGKVSAIQIGARSKNDMKKMLGL